MANNKDFKVKNGIKVAAYHETVGTVVSGSEGYNLASASYIDKSVSLSPTFTLASGLAFKPDGTKVYIVEQLSTGTVRQYGLSTAWDITTASSDSISKSLSAQDSTGYNVAFKPDGTKMYYIGFNDVVYQYSLSPAWDITSASYDSISYSVNAIDAITRNMFFGADGTKLYTVGDNNNSIYQHTLGTAWDLSTASSDSTSVSVAGQETNPSAVTFNNNGTVMLVTGTNTATVYQYNLTTAWDLSTASYSETSFTLSAPGATVTTPTGLFWGDNGNSLYVTAQSNAFVGQYSTTLITNDLDLSTGSVFEINANTDFKIGLSNPAASGTVSGATLLLSNTPSVSHDPSISEFIAVQDPISATFTGIFSVRFNNDGTKMYVGGADSASSSNGISELSLSVPWDITSVNTTRIAYYNSSGSNNVLDFFFKPDGTKLYVLGYSDDAVTQHTLSTPWDISTASSDSVSKSVNAQDVTPHSLFFKPDGTKFWMSGNSTALNEYTMSTPWDVSTASYTGNTTGLTGSTQYGIAFVPDGSKVYMMGASGVLYGYTLGTAWDATTLVKPPFMSYDAQTAANNNRPYALTFSEDGEYWYGVDQTEVIQFSCFTMPTVTYDTSIRWADGTAPESPNLGGTDILIFNTSNGGTTYNAALAIDGAQ